MSIRTEVAAAVLACVISWAASSGLAQEGAGGGENPFDGEWTLTFDVNTPPGGVTLRGMYDDSNSPYHLVFHALKKSFQVKEDGTFAWSEVDDGSLKINATYNPPPVSVGTPTTKWRESHQPVLKAGGKATATPTPPGSPQPYDRSLQVDLDWTGGNGTYFNSGGGSGAYIVAAGGEQVTVTGAVTTTLPMTYWQAKWTLKPTRIVREEISADEIRETTTYEGSRQAAVKTVMGNVKVTERIEVKHVRYLNLVPRG